VENLTLRTIGAREKADAQIEVRGPVCWETIVYGVF